MGEIYLELTIANIADRRRQKELAFLVDTGATRAWISKQVAKEFGIKKIGEVSLELAKGNARKFAYGMCIFAFNGETVAGNVIIGPPDSEPIVGTPVLQDFRLVIDLEHHTITRRRTMKAK